MVLGVTDNLKPSFENYVLWIQRVAPEAQIVKLSTGSIEKVGACDGIVLTGGGDVHPRFYGREDALDVVEDTNEARDESEFSIVREALTREIPILGVCRGLQLFNVAMGGTLIPDVRRAGYRDHSEGSDGQRTHGILLERGSTLHSIVGADRVDVNTSHHQAVERVGRGLRVLARSEDGLVESLGWELPAVRSFVLLVQWHPERMQDADSPAATGIARRFVQEIEEMKKTA